MLILLTRRLWFFGDEWDYLLARGLHHARFGLLAPHGEHWTTIPILIYRGLFFFFGARHYLPYLLVLFAFHLALTHLLWRVMVRAGANVWIATALAGVFALLGAGAENLVWAFQIALIGSLLLGWIFVELCNDPAPSRRRELASVGVGLLSLMFSGISVPMVAIGVMVIWMRRGFLQAIRILAPLAGVYGIWFLTYGRHFTLPGTPLRPSQLLGRIPSYVYRGVASSSSRFVGNRAAGIVLLAVVAAWIIWRRRRARGSQAPIFAGVIGVVITFVIIATGRAQLSAIEVTAPRYAYCALAMLLPALAVAVSDLVRRVSIGPVLVAVLIVPLLGVHNVRLLRSDAHLTEQRSQQVCGQLLAAVDIASHESVFVDYSPEPRFDPKLKLSMLMELRRRGQLATTCP